jgi:diacylglycerol kinase (ATP)
MLPAVRILVLHNPSSGRRKGRRKFARAMETLRRLGAEPEVLESRNAQHLTELARQAAAESPDLVVSAGGDGTHHYVLNGTFGSGVPLGILPLGSGNDLAKGLGIPLEPAAAASILLRGRVRRIDVARVSPVNGLVKQEQARLFCCIAGAGFDAVVNRFANDHVRYVHGSLAYAWSIVRCLKFYRPLRVDIDAGGEEFRGNIIFATVGNNTTYGGGLKMAPRARLDDGLLDVCIVTEMSKLELLRWLPNAYRGTHLRNRRILYFQAQTVTLSSEPRLELFADGEFMQDLPAKIEVVPLGAGVVVPQNRP